MSVNTVPVVFLLALRSCTCHVKGLYMYYVAAQVARSVIGVLMFPDQCESSAGAPGAASGLADVELTKISLSTAVCVMMRATYSRPILQAHHGHCLLHLLHLRVC